MTMHLRKKGDNLLSVSDMPDDANQFVIIFNIFPKSPLVLRVPRI